MINLVITEGALFVLLMVYILQISGSGPDPDNGFFIALGIAICVALPLAFFPFSRTIWAAIELMIRKPTKAEVNKAKSMKSEDAAWHSYQAAD